MIRTRAIAMAALFAACTMAAAAPVQGGDAMAATDRPTADAASPPPPTTDASAADTARSNDVAAAARPTQVRSPPATRSGADIYARFRAGLADKRCSADETSRWRRHFAHAPGHLTDSNRDVLPLFGYVVDQLIEAGLPTEFALIPFVESGYRPDARSASGPAGMWQFIAITARNQGIAIREGYDGRLSPVDSTQAAVRYLRTLYGMFGGNWELAVMGYNAGENRILGAIRRSGQSVRNADAARLSGVPDITRAYVRKLHALACVLDEADDRPQWRTAMQRQLPLYADVDLPGGVRSLDAWASRNGIDAQALRRMNPAFSAGRVSEGRRARVLAPVRGDDARFWQQVGPARALIPSGSGRTHTVIRGDTAGAIARRYGVPVAELLRRNRLGPATVLRPGQVLRVDE